MADKQKSDGDNIPKAPPQDAPMSFAERKENRKKALREILDKEAGEREAETKRLTAPSAPAQQPDVQSLTEKFNSLHPRQQQPQAKAAEPPKTERRETPPLSSLNEILSDIYDRSHSTPDPHPSADHSVLGTSFTVYDQWGNTSSKILGASGTMNNMRIDRISGDPSKVSVKSDDTPKGDRMDLWEAQRLVQYMFINHRIDTDQRQGFMNEIDLARSLPVIVRPSQKLQDVVRDLGGSNRNIVFESYTDQALKQQSLMASPAMLDSLKDGGMKHIFVTGYPQSMQEYATNVWDAARSSNPKLLEKAKESFVTAMEQKLPPDPLMLLDNAVGSERKSELYRNTADMIGEAAKRGMQVHFTGIPDPRTPDQADEEESRATGSPYQKMRYDRESEFIRLTAQEERFAVITGTGHRHIKENNSFEKQLKNTEHIYLTDKMPNPYLGFSRMDYYYAMDSQFMGGMKAPRDPLPPGASYRDTPAMGTP